jgi:hypothetical protein
MIKVVRQRVGPNKCQAEIIKSFGISRKATSRNQFIGLYRHICFSERWIDDLLRNANFPDEQYSVHDDCRRSQRSEKNEITWVSLFQYEWMSETRKRFIQLNINIVVGAPAVTSVQMMKIIRQINVVSIEQINWGMKRIIGSISFIIGDFRLLLKSEFWESKFQILCWLTIINLRFINFVFQVRSLSIFAESESKSDRSYKYNKNMKRITLLICMENCEWFQKACR